MPKSLIIHKAIPYRFKIKMSGSVKGLKFISVTIKMLIINGSYPIFFLCLKGRIVVPKALIYFPVHLIQDSLIHMVSHLIMQEKKCCLRCKKTYSGQHIYIFLCRKKTCLKNETLCSKQLCHAVKLVLCRPVSQHFVIKSFYFSSEILLE